MIASQGGGEDRVRGTSEDMRAQQGRGGAALMLRGPLLFLVGWMYLKYARWEYG